MLFCDPLFFILVLFLSRVQTKAFSLAVFSQLTKSCRGLVELKKQIEAGQSPTVLRKTLEKVEEILRVGGESYEA